MKICHLASGHGTDDTRILYKQCASLCQAGYDVDFVGIGESKKYCGVNVRGIDLESVSSWKRIIKYSKLVYEEGKELNADLYHLHDPELIPYGLKLKKQGKIVIMDLHENYSEIIRDKEWIPKMLRGVTQIAYNFYEKYAVRKFDAVIGVTPTQKKKLKSLNSKALIIPNFPILENEEIVHCKKNEKEKWIGFAGNINDLYCQNQILDALELTKNVKYKLMGRCEKDYLKKLKEKKAFVKVTYLGYVDKITVEKELRNCDIGICVLAYGNDSVGKMGTLGNTKLFEAMKASLPVICTDFILWKNIIQENNCGICVSPYSTEEIASSINYLANHPETAKKMGENGRKAIENKFNWKNCEKKLIELYAQFDC